MLKTNQLQRHSTCFFFIITTGFIVLLPGITYAIEEKSNYSMYLNIPEGLVDDDVVSLDQLRQQIYSIIGPVLKTRNKKIRLNYANDDLSLPTVAGNALPVQKTELAKWLKSDEVQDYVEDKKVDYLLLGRFDYGEKAHKLRIQVVDTKKIDQIVSVEKRLFESMGTIRLDKYRDDKKQLGEVRFIVKNIMHYLNNNIPSLKQRRVVQCGCFLFNTQTNPSPGMASIGNIFTTTFAKTLKDKYKKDESINIIIPKRQYARAKDCNEKVSFDAMYADLVITGAITPRSGNTNIYVDMDISNPRNDFEQIDIYSKQERTDETDRLANHLAKHAREVMEDFF